MIFRRKFVSLAAVVAMSGGFVVMPQMAHAEMIGLENVPYGDISTGMEMAPILGATSAYGYVDNDGDNKISLGDTINLRTTIRENYDSDIEAYDLSISSRENNMVRVPVPGSFGVGADDDVVYDSTITVNQDLLDGMPVWYIYNFKNKYGYEYYSASPVSFSGIGGGARTLPVLTSGISQMDTSVIRDKETGLLLQTYTENTTNEFNWDSANQTNSVDPSLKPDKAYGNISNEVHQARRISVGDIQYVAMKLRNETSQNWNNVSVRVPYETVFSSTCDGITVPAGQTVSCNVGITVTQDTIDWKHAADPRGSGEGVGAGISPIVSYDIEGGGSGSASFTSNTQSGALGDGTKRMISDQSMSRVSQQVFNISKSAQQSYLGDTVEWYYSMKPVTQNHPITGDKMLSSPGYSYVDLQLRSKNFGYDSKQGAVELNTTIFTKTCQVVEGDICYDTVNEEAKMLAYKPYFGSTTPSLAYNQMVPTNSIVDPSKPTLVDNPGWKNDDVIAPVDTDSVSYDLQYDRMTGVYSMTANATYLYAFDALGRKTATVSGALNVAPVIVTPEAPVIVDNPGYLNDTVTAPSAEDQISYVVDFDQKAGTWTMTATAAEGYVFSNGTNTYIVDGVMSTSNADVSGPTIIDAPSWIGDQVIAPADTDQVSYVLDYTQKTGDYTLTATPKPGYTLQSGQDTQVFTGKLNVDPITVSASAPTVVDAEGFEGDSVVAPANTDIIAYVLDYDQSSGKWTLTATAAEGYAFDAEGTTTHVQTGQLDIVVPVQTVKVSPEKPVIVDKPGYVDDSVSAPSNTEGVTYQLSYDQSTGDYTLTATTQPGYVFEDGATVNVQTGKLDVTPVAVPPAPVVDVVVVAEKPVIVDKPGYLNDTVTAPKDTVQVKYVLVYDKKTGKWELTATAADGYVFADGTTVNKQSGVLDAKPIIVSPASPSVIDKDGWKNDSVKPPANNARITYTLDYNQEEGTYELMAQTAEGYVFADGTTVNVQAGELDVFTAPVPEVIQTGQVADDNGTGPYLWGSLSALLGFVVGFLFSRKR